MEEGMGEEEMIMDEEESMPEPARTGLMGRVE